MTRIFTMISRIFLGKGIDKRFPFLIRIYKYVYSFLADKKEYLVDIPLEGKLYVSGKDLGVGMYLRSKQCYESEMTKKFIEIINKNDTVFDIGANVGYYTVLASKLVGKKGKVYAFEPEQTNLKRLKKNVVLNKCKNVEIVEMALSDSTGEKGFQIEETNPGESRLIDVNNEKSRIRTITLDDFFKKKKINKVEVIKIDVEGREPWVLLGGKEYFSKKNPVKLFLECNQKALKEIGYDYMDLIKLLKSMRFKLKYIFNEATEKTYKYEEKVLREQLKIKNYLNLYAIK